MSRKAIIAISVSAIVVVAMIGIVVAFVVSPRVSDRVGTDGSTNGSADTMNIEDGNANAADPTAGDGTPTSSSSHDSNDSSTAQNQPDAEEGKIGTSTSVSNILDSTVADVETNFPGIISTGTSDSGLIASGADIPDNMQDMGNIVYRIAECGGDMSIVYEGSERRDVNILSVDPISIDNGMRIVGVSYDFTVHYLTAMDLAGIPDDKKAHADATLKINSAGKIIDWRETVNWNI